VSPLKVPERLQRTVNLWADFMAFHKAQVETGDLDPAYPVLRAILKIREVHPQSERGLWLSVLHSTWYHLGSTIRAWDILSAHADNLHPLDVTALAGLGLPCATERRGNRVTDRLALNLGSWARTASKDGIRAYVQPNEKANGAEQWRTALGRIEGIWGNGRWAAYKLAELFQKVNGMPFIPQDMGHQNSTGPRHGLKLLVPTIPEGNTADDIAKLDIVSASLVNAVRGFGLNGAVEEVETSLCDFHALCDGRYYVGHDIDAMREQVRDLPGEQRELATMARMHSLPLAYIGEGRGSGGWDGVDLARNKVYRDTGEIVLRS
jgi:hypothetical protein